MKIFHSLAGMVVGWCVAFLVYLAPRLWGGRVTDVASLMFWSSIFSFIAWIVFVIPLVCVVSSRRRIMRWPWVLFAGAGLGVAMCGALVLS